MCIPSKKEWYVERADVHQVVKEKLEDNAKFVLGQDQLENTFAALSNSMFDAFPTGTGVSLDELLSTRPGAAPSPCCGSSSTAASSAAPGPKMSAANDNDEDDAMAGVSKRPWQGTSAAPHLHAAADAAAGGDLANAVAVAKAKGKAKAKANPAGGSQSIPAVGAAKPSLVQVGQQAAGQQGDRGRGRPKRPPLEVARETIKEFQTCESDEKYFGQFPNHRRAVERVLREISMLEQNSETQRVQKQLQAMADISRVWARKSTWDANVSKQYHSSKLFLFLEPAVELPFPPWLQQLAHSEQAEAPFQQS